MPLTGLERIIFDTLARRYPRAISSPELVEEMYRDHYNGGPEQPERVMRVVLTRLRHKLAGTGWTIPKRRSGRGNVSRYRLEREQ